MSALKYVIPLALALCLWTALPAEAAHGGGGGGHGGSGGGHAGFGGGHAGFGGGYGRGYAGYGGYGRGYGGYGRGYGGYYGGYGGGYYGGYGYYPGYGYGLYGYSPYYGYGYSYPVYGGYPVYGYDYGYVVPPVLGSNVTPALATQNYAYVPPAPAVDNLAHVRVIVPANAKVWFDGAATKETGSQREFVSPPLSDNGIYAYTVKATWMQDGKPVEHTLKVKVERNKTSVADFNSMKSSMG